METEYQKEIIIALGIILIGFVLVVLSFIFAGHPPDTKYLETTILTKMIFTNSFISFGIGFFLMIIGFAKLYAERNNKWLHEV